MTTENLYQQAQVFLDASVDGQPLLVNSKGDLQVAGLGRRSVESLRNMLLTPHERNRRLVQRNRKIVKTLIHAIEEASGTNQPAPQVPLTRAVELLNSAYETGELPAARAFVNLLRQVKQTEAV